MTLNTSTPEQRHAAMFALLGDPLRLRIVDLLATEQLCTCHLIDATGAKQTTISHHLRILREAGAVTAEEVGRFTWYRLSPDLLTAMTDRLAGLARAAQLAQRERQPCGP